MISKMRQGIEKRKVINTEQLEREKFGDRLDIRDKRNWSILLFLRIGI